MFTTVTLFAHAAEEPTGIAALGIDGKALLIQLVTFVLAYLVLRRFAFGPILKALNERREKIESGVSLGEAMQKERAALDEKVASTLRDSRKEAEGIIANAQDAAKQTVREAEDKAKTKAEGIIREAESRIEQDTARARKQLEQELVGLISDATEAIIDEKVDAKKDAALIDRAIKGRAAA